MPLVQCHWAPSRATKELLSYFSKETRQSIHDSFSSFSCVHIPLSSRVSSSTHAAPLQQGVDHLPALVQNSQEINSTSTVENAFELRKCPSLQAPYTPKEVSPDESLPFFHTSNEHDRTIEDIYTDGTSIHSHYRKHVQPSIPLSPQQEISFLSSSSPSTSVQTKSDSLSDTEIDLLSPVSETSPSTAHPSAIYTRNYYFDFEKPPSEQSSFHSLSISSTDGITIQQSNSLSLPLFSPIQPPLSPLYQRAQFSCLESIIQQMIPSILKQRSIPLNSKLLFYLFNRKLSSIFQKSFHSYHTIMIHVWSSVLPKVSVLESVLSLFWNYLAPPFYYSYSSPLFNEDYMLRHHEMIQLFIHLSQQYLFCQLCYLPSEMRALDIVSLSFCSLGIRSRPTWRPFGKQ